MILSQIFAWISVFFCGIEVFRYVARISRVEALNHFFHKIHIPFGVLLLVTCCFHGLLAGNPADAILTEIEIAPAFLTINWGTMCFLCAILLAVSYLLRKKLRAWMLVHRVLTVFMIVLLVIHLADVGIHLPERWTSEKSIPPIEHMEGSQKSDSSDVVATATPTPVATATPKPQIVSENIPMDEPASSDPVPDLVSEDPEVSEPGIPHGVYTGTGQGRNGEITVCVTVDSGEIVDIQIVSHAETPKYFSRAEEIVNTILSKQSTEVDAVAGATISSNGIKSAVADALGRG